MNNTYLHVPDIVNFDVEYYINKTGEAVPKRVYPMHIDDRMELYVLLEGDVSFVVESSLYKLSPGDAILTKPNEQHHCILNSHSVHSHICFWFDSSCAFLFSDFLTHDFGQNNLISPDAESKRRLSEIYGALEEARDEGNGGKQFYLLLEMLHIFRGFLLTDPASQALPPQLKEILSDIDKNFKEIGSLEYLRQKYYISATTLNRLFREYLHITPKYYLDSKRLSHARILLKNGESVLNACLESGFSDCSNFIRLFKKRFGITPSQYKTASPQKFTPYE